MTENELINKYKNYLNENKIIKTKFLNLNEKELLSSIIKNKKNIRFFGGFINSEYECAIIKSGNELILDNEFNISVYKIIYNKKYLTITNQNVLGTLMSLGIKRDRIGDIIINNDECYFAISKEIEKYILENFNSINNTKIFLEKTDELILKKYDYINKNITVQSLRLDLILSHVLNISRDKSKDLILNNLIKVNQKIILNPSLILKPNDLISIRGKGRLLIIEQIGISKKDKLIIKVGTTF